MELILIRGLPGSGKSTLARRLMDANSKHLEADQYFMEDGEYNFVAENLRFAHQWCKEETGKWLQRDFRVVVSNTFTTIKELKPYFLIAKEFGIVPLVVHCQSNFGSIHNVPEETLAKMKDRWCNNIDELFTLL